jgi:DNA-binding beta-propeller fold protein YncE
MRNVFSAPLLNVICILAAACGGEREVSGPRDVSPDKAAFVVTTDYTTGSTSVIDLSTRAADNDVAPVHSDAVARFHDGKIYVINRLGQDNVQILDPGQNYATLRQVSVGPGSNPQDIAFADGKAFVSRMGSNKILVVEPDDIKKIGEIDLSFLADADGFCEPGLMYSDGARVFVTVLRLDRNDQYAPTDKSFVVVIDAATETLVGNGIALHGVNPWPGFASDGARLFVANSGRFGAGNGDIELVDTESLATAITVQAGVLGGDVNQIAAHNGVLYTVVSDANFNTALVAFDTQSGEKKTLMATEGFNLAGIAVNDRDELYVSDRTVTRPGVRIVNLRTGSEVTSAPIDTGLPPFMILFTKW